MSIDNYFAWFAEAGYEDRLLPIVPPGADISRKSSLIKRPKDIGKAPGVRGVDGLWKGLSDWQNVVSTPEQRQAWHASGAGVGMKMGAGLIAVDIDVMDKTLSEQCGSVATAMLGTSLNRVGRRPKRAKLYRTTEPVPYQRVTFEGGAVEILSDGKQLVVHGIHPATGEPYIWDQGRPRFVELPEVSAAQVAAYMAKLAERLPAAKVETSTLAADHTADPAQLAGAEADVRRAMEALPNTFADRQTYINVAQALKGALSDNPELAFELFDAWAAKWPDYNADNTAADWRRTQPSRSLGASYLFDLAQKHSAGAFETAQVFFKDIPPAPQEPATSPSQAQLASFSITAAEWLTARAGRPAIVENWFYEDIGHLAAPGGVGKTTLLLFQAVHIVLGRPLFGCKVKRRGPVIYMTAEDDKETMVARLRLMCAELGLSADETVAVRDGVKIIDVAGRGVKLTEVRNDTVKPSEEVGRLIDTVGPIGASMLFIDPLVSFGIGESRVNDAEQGLIDVARRLRADLACGVHFVHHTGKENARAKRTDQYSGRGGSALADGSRITHVMQSLDAEEWRTATGLTLEDGASGLVYARPKLTWAPPNQPDLYIKRRGYTFIAVKGLDKVDAARAQVDSDVEMLAAFFQAAETRGERYTFEDMKKVDICGTRTRRLAALTKIKATGRVAVVEGERAPGIDKGPRPNHYILINGALD